MLRPSIHSASSVLYWPSRSGAFSSRRTHVHRQTGDSVCSAVVALYGFEKAGRSREYFRTKCCYLARNCMSSPHNRPDLTQRAHCLQDDALGKGTDGQRARDQKCTNCRADTATDRHVVTLLATNAWTAISKLEYANSRTDSAIMDVTPPNWTASEKEKLPIILFQNLNLFLPLVQRRLRIPLTSRLCVTAPSMCLA